MRYKFTEIKGIKRIKKSFTCMNVCDIQYPRLDEDFVTTDTEQTIRGRKTFTNETTFQSTLSSSSLIKTTGAVSGSTGIFQEAYLKTPNEVRQVYAYTNESISRVQFKTVPVSISSALNAEITATGKIDISATEGINLNAQSGGINVDGRLLPVQEYSYLGDSDHVWFYAHINELTAEEVSAGVLGAGNHAQFTYEGFVKALQVANNVPANGTFQFLTVLAARVSTGETITGGNNVKTLNIIASPSTNMSLSMQSSDTTSDQKWVAVTGGSARSVQTPTEWIFVLAVRIP